MKIAISIPDALFADVESLVHRLGRSRSRLYTDALREYLARHDPQVITTALDQLCDELEPQADDVLSLAGRRLLERVEW